MIQKHWEHIPHQADIGVRGVGASKEESFEQAAVGLTAVITDPQTVAPKEMIEVSCEASGDELLLVDWLNALIYEIATRKMLFSRFEVHITGNRLRGKAWGEKINVERHQPAVEIKGATCTSLLVRRNQDGAWLAQCVVDV